MLWSFSMTNKAWWTLRSVRRRCCDVSNFLEGDACITCAYIKKSPRMTKVYDRRWINSKLRLDQPSIIAASPCCSAMTWWIDMGNQLRSTNLQQGGGGGSIQPSLSLSLPLSLMKGGTKIEEICSCKVLHADVNKPQVLLLLYFSWWVVSYGCTYFIFAMRCGVICENMFLKKSLRVVGR